MNATRCRAYEVAYGAIDCWCDGNSRFHSPILVAESVFEVREYLLNKWSRKCGYCGAENIPLQVEHIQARARGGSEAIAYRIYA